jgi:hypothetical protein
VWARGGAREPPGSTAAAPTRAQEAEQKAAKKLKLQVERLEATVKSQAQTIHELAVERENEKAASEKLHAKADALRLEIRERDQQGSTIAGELSEAKTQRGDRAAAPPDEVMPLSVWRCPEFDRALGQQIERIALNSLLPPASKLSQIYRAITKFYAAPLRDKGERVKAVVSQCIVGVSIMLPLSASSSDDLVNQGGAQKIVQQVAITTRQLEDANRRAQEYAVFAEHFQNMFGTGNDLFARATAVKEAFDRREMQLKAKHRKTHELRSRLKESAVVPDRLDRTANTLDNVDPNLAKSIRDVGQSMPNVAYRLDERVVQSEREIDG